ncbi:hypothetical protein LCGC14_2316100 [marine sediment metagenome]|uniref:Uncharacterized protein n=1 Tax=marine sediment metagenome TaxID=412755 RepID=A0A0F9FE44_9ZZZZ
MSLNDEDQERNDEDWQRAASMGERLSDLAALSRHFRAHPSMPWGMFCTLAIRSGFTEGEADLIWWASAIESINRFEEDHLSKQLQRN